ncbi:hypothetical protein QEH59_13605 [Coraliomargarita sp. SDUM461004]|uniref:ApeA N-terminal domain-containing protein n=1 Tax=Thalassobacterium sedimentorum TaxID=3041258 RepID=A0ABU1AKX9_9BACT|nr:hypothetical protein [Coraliomargarita sp. SDUM461004]MDQ8195466.1 hypothetical protein [Coraliomargarita sp. SDUM461004]
MSQISDIRQQVQAGTLRLDLDYVHVRSQTGEWHHLVFPCWISTEDGQLLFHFRAGQRNAVSPEIAQLFDLSFGGGLVTVGSSDWLEVSARTATGVHVLLRSVSPVPHQTYSPNMVLSAAFDFGRIELPLSNMGQLSLPEVDQYLAGTLESEEERDQIAVNRPIRDWFQAVIPGVKLLIEPNGTSTVLQHPFHGELPSSRRCCYVGEVSGGEFCLENKDGDLEVIFRRDVDEASVEEARRIFDGILNAVGFMHGCHPWPGYFSHGRRGQTLECWVRPVSELQKGVLLPMRKSRMYFSEDGRNLFLRAAEFFSNEGEVVRYYNRSLWLMRSACDKHVAFPVRLMTLCSILEGVLKRFSRRYREDVDIATLRLGDADSWRSAVDRAGLDWQEFLPVYESRQTIRNQLAHGFDPDPGNRNSAREFDAYSRISGAIYILMAKRMGFRGQLERSQLEGDDLVDLGAITT